jgi:hypothetical protein
MPTERVSVLSGAEAVATAITKLEQTGSDVVSVCQIGDEYLIVYRQRPKQTRSKMETR